MLQKVRLPRIRRPSGYQWQGNLCNGVPRLPTSHPHLLQHRLAWQQSIINDICELCNKVNVILLAASGDNIVEVQWDESAFAEGKRLHHMEQIDNLIDFSRIAQLIRDVDFTRITSKADEMKLVKKGYVMNLNPAVEADRKQAPASAQLQEEAERALANLPQFDDEAFTLFPLPKDAREALEARAREEAEAEMEDLPALEPVQEAGRKRPRTGEEVFHRVARAQELTQEGNRATNHSQRDIYPPPPPRSTRRHALQQLVNATRRMRDSAPARVVLAMEALVALVAQENQIAPEDQVAQENQVAPEDQVAPAGEEDQVAPAPTATAEKKEPTWRQQQQQKKQAAAEGCSFIPLQPIFGRSIRLSKSKIEGLRAEQDDYIWGTFIKVEGNYALIRLTPEGAANPKHAGIAFNPANPIAFAYREKEFVWKFSGSDNLPPGYLKDPEARKNDPRAGTHEDLRRRKQYERASPPWARPAEFQFARIIQPPIASIMFIQRSAYRRPEWVPWREWMPFTDATTTEESQKAKAYWRRKSADDKGIGEVDEAQVNLDD